MCNNETTTEAISIRLLTLLVFISGAFCFVLLSFFCFAHFRFFFFFHFLFCFPFFLPYATLFMVCVEVAPRSDKRNQMSSWQCKQFEMSCVCSSECVYECVCERVCECVCVCVRVCILWPPHYKRVYSSSHGADFRFPFPLARFALSVSLSRSLSPSLSVCLGSAASCWCRITVLRLIMQMP